MRTDLVHVLLRRWYLVLCGVAVTAAMLAAVLVLYPLKYSAKADILLLPPKSQSTDNPLLGLGGLEDVPATIARSVLDDAAVAQLASHGVTGGYSVTVDLTTSAPLLVAKATGATKAEALDAMNRVAALVPATLQRLQQEQNVAHNALITSTVIHADQDPSPVTRTRTRLLLAATAVGLLLSGLVIVGIDRLLLRRRRNRARPAPADEPDETDDLGGLFDEPAADTEAGHRSPPGDRPVTVGAPESPREAPGRGAPTSSGRRRKRKPRPAKDGDRESDDDRESQSQSAPSRV